MTVTITTGGVGTMFYVGIVGSSMSVVGSSFKLYLDSKGKHDISNLIPTGYTYIVSITLIYTIGDTEEVRRVNAILDVLEGFIFFDKKNILFDITNITIQGFELCEEFSNDKSK